MYFIIQIYGNIPTTIRLQFYIRPIHSSMIKYSLTICHQLYFNVSMLTCWNITTYLLNIKCVCFSLLLLAWSCSHGCGLFFFFFHWTSLKNSTASVSESTIRLTSPTCRWMLSVEPCKIKVLILNWRFAVLPHRWMIRWDSAGLADSRGTNFRSVSLCRRS